MEMVARETYSLLSQMSSQTHWALRMLSWYSGDLAEVDPNGNKWDRFHRNHVFEAL
jgi:hypothetical protein